MPLLASQEDNQKLQLFSGHDISIWRSEKRIPKLFMILWSPSPLPPACNTHSLTTTICLEIIKLILLYLYSCLSLQPQAASDALVSPHPCLAPQSHYLLSHGYIVNILFFSFIFLSNTHQPLYCTFGYIFLFAFL